MLSLRYLPTRGQPVGPAGMENQLARTHSNRPWPVGPVHRAIPILICLLSTDYRICGDSVFSSSGAAKWSSVSPDDKNIRFSASTPMNSNKKRSASVSPEIGGWSHATNRTPSDKRTTGSGGAGSMDDDDDDDKPIFTKQVMFDRVVSGNEILPIYNVMANVFRN